MQIVHQTPQNWDEEFRLGENTTRNAKYLP